MLKRLALALAALTISAFAMAQEISIVSPMVIVTPNLLDLTDRDIVIEKDLSDNGNIIRTSTKLTLFQDAKGKLTGTAEFDSSRQVPGNPEIGLPVSIPVKGKIKGNTFILKGKLKVAGGATAHSRTVSLKLSGVVDPSTIIYPEESDEGFQSTMTAQSAVSISGLGFGYNFAATHSITGYNWFGIQPVEDAAGLKPLPGNAGYFEVFYPMGYEVVPVYLTVVNGDSVLNFKGKSISGQLIDVGGNGTSEFAPDQVSLKTKSGTENLIDPVFAYGSFEIIIQEPVSN